MSGKYDDIIHLPHHVSKKHPPMPIANRAAQFSPFAALTGYEAALEETRRITEPRKELGESAVALLNAKIRLITEMLGEKPEVAITYFLQDETKDGGAYITATGAVKKIDEYEKRIVMETGDAIPIADILDIRSELFKGLV